MVQYLGQYSYNYDPEGFPGKTYNLILEYGEMDLDEFFFSPATLPPVRSEEIIAFWRSLFKIAEALQRVHELPYKRVGIIRHYDGYFRPLFGILACY
jgi:hypothetical protein